MGLPEIQLPHNHQVAMNRFITACQVVVLHFFRILSIIAGREPAGADHIQ
jgi:hypothetical protein